MIMALPYRLMARDYMVFHVQSIQTQADQVGYSSRFHRLMNPRKIYFLVKLFPHGYLHLIS